MPKTLDDLNEWAVALRKENHPLAETMEEIADEWRKDIDCIKKGTVMNDDLGELVSERLEQIKNMAGDSDCAHYEEKELWREVLAWAAAGYDVKDAAKQALTTAEIDFPRWFA